METIVGKLTPRPPYDFELTAAHATRFRGGDAVESFADGVYHRVLDLGFVQMLATVRSAGTVESPRLDVELTSPSLTAVAGELGMARVARMLATNDDLGLFYDMASSDALLAPLVRELYGLHLPQTETVWEGLVLAILGQQISSQVARVLRTLLVETYGATLSANGTEYTAFPRPEKLAAAGADRLREIKFSGRKAEYVAGIASMVSGRELDLEALRGLPDEEIASSLLAIRGVGPWTVAWLLIHTVGRRDGFPEGDLALQRTLSRLLNLKGSMSPREAAAYSVRWSPLRSYVVSYLFAAIRSGRL